MAEALSKSAKKRAAKQARDAAHEADAPAAAPVPAPEPKKEEAKPKEKPKAKAAAAAAAPKAAAAAPKAEAKKSAGKKKEVVAAAPPPVPKKESDPMYDYQVDDGSGGSWETAAGVSKKNQKRQDKKDEEERKQKELEIEKAKAAKAALKAGAAAPVPYAGVVDKSGMSATQAAIARARELANAPSSVVPVVSANASTEKVEEVKTNHITASVTVPEGKIGRVIGPGGKNLKMIQEKTHVHKIDTNEGVFTITGDADGVAQAESAIKEMVEKGYMSLAYDNFQQNEIMANPATFPDIIGKGGCVIMAMKKELEVEISIPAVPKDTPPSKKQYPISVAGSKDNIDKAKACIESIINYYHHEITHPGLDHVEMEVEQWAYSFIIGKAGSEMRHIQKNWDVKVYIPREHSANQNVVVVGQKKDCEAAKKYMEKQIADAGEKKNTDKRQDKPDDHWGKEEPEEPWMKDYMYQRKA